MSIEPLPSDGAPETTPPRRGKVVYLLNTAVFLLLGWVGFMTYSYLAQGGRSAEEPPTAAEPAGIIQLDVLNGCGARGAGAAVTAGLRAAGFDVVEMKNYRSFDVAKTLVVDRVGNLERARRVASALGVDPSNVIQQINPDYFVDVSVIVGGDYDVLVGGMKQRAER